MHDANELKVMAHLAEIQRLVGEALTAAAKGEWGLVYSIAQDIDDASYEVREAANAAEGR